MSNIDPTAASRAVLIEVANVLGAYRPHLVLVGGWVPELLFPNKGHLGSIDVDLAVAPTALADDAYQSILKRMLEAGYSQESAPTRFVKQVAGATMPVKVDLISGQYQGGEKAEAITVNELRINSLRGIDLAFQACDEIDVSGVMPDGTRNDVRVRIVRPEAFILVKAFALNERTKDKDAYDIAFVLRHYEPSLAEMAERLKPLVASGLGREALQILKSKFASVDSVGPVWAARAVPGTAEDVELLQRAAFEDAQELFRLLGT